MRLKWKIQRFIAVHFPAIWKGWTHRQSIWNCYVLGWKNAEEEFPEIGEKVLVKYKPNAILKYIPPEEFPEFAESEKEKRCWYQFTWPDGTCLNAIGTFWKPLKRAKNDHP